MNLPLATAFISFYKVFYFTMLIEAGFLPPPSASPSIFLCICFPLRPLMILLFCYDVCLFPYFCFVCIVILLLLIIVLFILCILLHLFLSLELVMVEVRSSECEGFYLWGCNINHQMFSARHDPWPLPLSKELVHIYQRMEQNGSQIKSGILLVLTLLLQYATYYMLLFKRVRLFIVFESSLLCSPRLHLFYIKNWPVIKQ